MSTPKSMDLSSGLIYTKVKTDRLEHAALRADAKGNKRGTVLLIHGFTSSKEDFIHVLPLLAELGWDSIAVDQRGCHESPGSEDVSEYVMATYAADMQALVNSFDQPVHLLGHSFGGLVAQAAASIGCNLKSLTIFCSGPGAIPGESEIWLKGFIQDLQNRPKIDIVEENLQSMSGNSRDGLSTEVEQFLKTRWLNTKTAALLGKAEILLNQENLTTKMQQLRLAGVPILVTHGENDDAWPIAEQLEMAHLIGAEYVVIPDSAHSPNVENYPVMVEILDQFWSAH